MHFSLGTAAKAAGYRVETFDSIGSTNTAALDAAKAGDPGRCWFVSDHQTSGRGRRGRTWHTEKGNLAASLLLKFERADPQIASLGFVAGVALGTALRSMLSKPGVRVGAGGAISAPDCEPVRIELKWPNDVLADGAKLAGILLEAQNLADGTQVIAVGMGVNIVSSPSDVPYPTAYVRETSRSVTAQDVFESLSNAWAPVFDLWHSENGVAEVLSVWRSMAAGLGADVAVSTAGGIVRGVFVSLDDQGRLLIRQASGAVTTIAAGDVHFGGTASATNNPG